MEDQDKVEIVALIWKRWSQAFENLKFVQNEKNDGSPDWNEFHVDRLEHATLTEKYWLDIKNRYMDEHREIFNRMMDN